jgi:hypothetical protein
MKRKKPLHKKNFSKSSETARETTSSTSIFLVVLAIVYIVLVLAVDTLAVHGVRWPFDWSSFQWRIVSPWHWFGFIPPDWVRSPLLSRLDVFKLLFWFVIPLLVSLRTMDWRWISPRGWKRNDWLLLGVMLILGGIAVGSIPFIPALKSAYPGLSGTNASSNHVYFIAYLLWIASWLPGWEFMHRYFLLRPVMQRFPRFIWLIVPLSETIYHLQKSWLEAVGMMVFSLLLTWWTMKRRNMLLPFVAHLYIEILLAFALVYLF